MTILAFKEINENAQEVKNERFKKKWTRQNNVRTFGKCYLRQSDERTNRYKTRNVENTLAQCRF